MSSAHSFDAVVQGGPLDGQRVANNASKGFVLVDLDKKLAWVHDYEDHFLFRPTFKAREAEPLDEEKLAKASEDGGRSVIVFDGENSDG